MELPIALQRMLEVSSVSDKLKSWNIYQEKYGSYTFKIRFIPNEVRHFESTCKDIPASTPVLNDCVNNFECAFRRKSQKQLQRDNARAQVWQEKRITRSQTAKPSTDNNPGTEGQSAISKDGSIETFLQDSFSLNAEAPEFVSPMKIDSARDDIQDSTTEHINMTSRDIPDISFMQSLAYDDEYVNKYRPVPGICTRMCVFGDDNPCTGTQPDFKCQKCGATVCEMCLNNGGHQHHLPYMKLVIPASSTVK